jgi:hypothetical protein
MGRTPGSRLSFATIGLFLAMGTLAAGCGGSLRVAIRSTAPAMAPVDAEARLRLGTTTVRAGADVNEEIARLVELARLADRLEQRTEAIAAASSALRLAQGYALAHPEDAARQADRRAVEHLALAIFDRHAANEQVLALAESSLDGASAEILLRALENHPEGGPLTDAVWSRLDARGRAHAAWAHRLPLGAPPIALSDVRSLGSEGIPMAEQRVIDAAVMNDLRGLREAAQLLAELDPPNPIALAFGAVERELRAGTLRDESLLLACSSVTQSAATGSAVARLLLAIQESPGSHALPLVLALNLHWAEAIGDAHALAAAHRGASEPDLAMLAAGIEALSALHLGDTAPYVAFEAAHPEVRTSPSWVAQLLSLEDRSNPSDPVSALAARARRTSGLRGRPDYYGLSRDAEAPSDLRRAALERYAGEAPATARVLASCIADSLSTGDCASRLEAIEVLIDPARTQVETFSLLGDALTPAMLYDLEEPWVTEVELAAAAWLDRRRESTDGYTEAWVFARLSVALGAGDVDGARALLEERGALLSPAYRAGVRMAIRAVDAGEDFYAIYRTVLPALPALGERPALEEGEVPTGYGCLLGGAPSPECETFLARLGDEAPELRAGAEAVYGTALHASVDLTALLGIAHAADPGGTPEAMIEALGAEAAGDTARASELFLALTLADPSLAEVDRRYLHHASLSGAPMPVIADAISASELLASAPRDTATLVRETGILDGRIVARLYDLDPSAFVDLGELGARHRRFVDEHEDRIVVALRRAPTSDARRALAQRLLPLLRALDGVTNARLLRAQNALLAGDPAEALAAADRPIRNPEDSLPLPQITEVRDLIAVFDALPYPLLEHLLLARPTGRSRNAESLAVFLAPVLAIASADPRLLPLLCAEHARAGDAASAVATCGPLHARVPSPSSATRLAFGLAFAEPPPGLDVDAFFEDALAPSTPSSLSGDALSVLAWNDALRLARAERSEESAHAALLALRAGFTPSSLGTWELSQVRWRGVELRTRAGGSADRVYMALAEGNAPLAAFYASAGQRVWLAQPEEARRSEASYANLCLAADLAAWASDDLAAGRIDAESLATWDRLRRSAFASDEFEALADRFPSANIIRLGVAIRAADRGQNREAYEAIQPLLTDAPRASLAVLFRRAIGLASSRTEADETVARLRASFPNDPRLIEDEATILPEALVSADALAAFLATVTDEELARLNPVVRVDGAGHALAAFPSTASPLGSVFGAQAGSVRLLAGAEARLAHCEGDACLDSILPSFDAMGMSTVWRAEVMTQAGPGARALLAGPGGAGLFTVVPRGSVLFVLGAFGQPDQIAGRLRSYALLERSFTPLDVAVPSGWATSIAGTQPDEATLPVALRIEALQLLATTSQATCPIRPLLDRLPSVEARETLVRTLFMGREAHEQRLALLACVDPEGPGHAALGLAAALDGSSEVHALGRTMLAHDGPAARALSEQLLDLDPGRALSGVAHRDSALPPFAGVELLLALPEVERRTLTATLWTRGTPTSRALAVVAEQVLPGSLDHALMRETMRSGPAPEAITAADVLYGSTEPADLEAARARLDALVAPLDEPSRVLGVRLVWELARRLDRVDIARFSTFAERLRESAPTSRDARLYEWTAERVEEELAVVQASLSARPTDLSEEVESSLETYRGMRRLSEHPRTSARVAASLATESLARVLPGSHWSYVRVPSPSLLIATLEAMYHRLESGSASDGALARQTLAFMLEQSNAALLGDEGGLDLSRPIECATADRFPRAWVCAAYVADADRVRDVLADRRYGTNSGAWLAVEAARQARSLPIAAGGMPYELADMLSEEPPPSPASAGAIVLRERARTEVDLDGVRVLRYATFVSREGEDTGVDTEHYLFTGDRLVMFGLEETARALLAEPLPLGRTLAGQPRFRALTEGWTDGSVLQLVNVGFRSRMLPAPLPDDDMGFELSAWDEGLVGRIRMPFTESTEGVDDLLARLPEGALSSMAFVPDSDAESEDEEAESSASPGAPSGTPEAPSPEGWRSYLVSHASRFALGWYGAGPATATDPRDRVWGDWTAVLRPGEALTRELTAWSAFPTEGATLRRDGLLFGRRGDVLVVSTTEAALNRALATPAVTAGRARTAIVGSAHLDGTRTAAVARELSSSLRRDDPRREQLELIAAILGLAREVSFDARADERRRELVITARVTPNLGPPGEEHSLVDELLLNARNAVTLPRALNASELRAPLRLVITTTEPDVVATRGFGGHPRVSAEVRDAGTLVLTVRPSDATPSPLSEVQRAGLLASTAALRIDSETIVARALALAPPGTTPAAAAQAIVTWVHDHIRYELTADEVDAPTVLERGRGDCSELARITTSLLRAAGIPAEMREGFLMVGGEMGAHAWVAYHDGTAFREIDPTAGRADVDSGYLPSSVLTVMGLAAIGDLRIIEAAAAR